VLHFSSASTFKTLKTLKTSLLNYSDVSKNLL
jgi:hypothetical protein